MASCRVLSVVAPRLWNQLPEDLRTASVVYGFQWDLTTHLFCPAVGEGGTPWQPLLNFYVALHNFICESALLLLLSFNCPYVIHFIMYPDVSFTSACFCCTLLWVFRKAV